MHLLTLLFLIVPQQTVENILEIVTRSAEGPVAEAVVRVAGREARTNAQGRAELRLPVGSYPLAVSAEGYLEVTSTVTIAAGDRTTLEISLTPRIEIHEQVVVTAARTDRRLEDEPVRIEVVDREDIEEKALMTPGSVAMLLGETTGLRVQTTSPALGAANVRIQGLRGRYSQLLSDGLPLYGVQGDSFSLLQVPPLDLGQVEILKGPASALYGASALGGVINLVSQRPAGARRQELLLNASTQSAGDLSFWAVEPPRGNWAFTAIGGLHGQARQDLDQDGWSDLPYYLRGAFRPRLFWQDSRGRSLFVTVGVMAEDRQGGTMPAEEAYGRKPFPQDLNTRRVDGGAVARIPLGGGRLLTVRGSWSRRGEERHFGENVEESSRITWLGEAVLFGKSGRHAWVIGGATQQDRYRNQDVPRFDYNFTSPGLIAQDEITLNPVTTLGVSARLDYHSRYGTFASPRISLLYKPNRSWTTRLSTGTGFFAPTPFVEETEETGLAKLQPMSGLVAEKARGVSLDTSWSAGPFELVGTVFGSRVARPVQRRFTGLGWARLENAASPTRTWGTELLLRFRREELTVLATHGYTQSSEENPEAPGRREVPLTPRNVASLNAIWENEKWGRVGLECYFIGRQPLEENPYRQTARSYVLFGALLQKRLGSAQLFVNFENLGNIRQTRYDPLVRPSPGPDGRWTVDAWAPLDGRVINGGVRLFF